MKSIHLIHSDRYDIKAGRFFPNAFRNNGGSLSILGVECIAGRRVTPCEHIRKHYDPERFADIASKPPVFWIFETERTLPGGHRIRRSGKRQKCHFVVEGLSDPQLWAAFERQKVNISDLWICANGDHRALTLEDVIDIQRKTAAARAARRAQQQPKWTENNA